MSGRGGQRKVLLPPINFIFKLLQQRNTVQIWLFEQVGSRIEGKIRGFDEFMNLVVDDAVEVKQPGKGQTAEDVKGQRRELGESEEELHRYTAEVQMLTRVQVKFCSRETTSPLFRPWTRALSQTIE